GQLRETLTALARAYLNIILSQDGLSFFRVVVADAPRFPELAHRFYVAGPDVMTAMISELLASATASGELELSGLEREAAARLFINLVRSEPQLQCLTHPHATPSTKQIDQWIDAAVTTFMRAFGRERHKSV
ncbi:MAG: TetR/AcrR family transcriptional regulator C-terminal domain-containing protein, partial [Thiohalomonadaceae bacterium]